MIFVNIQPSEKCYLKKSMCVASKINAFAFDLPISEPSRLWPSGFEAELRLHRLLLLLCLFSTARNSLVRYLCLFNCIGLCEMFILLTHEAPRIHQDLNLLLADLGLKGLRNRRIPRPWYLPALAEPKQQSHVSADHSTTTNNHYNHAHLPSSA